MNALTLSATRRRKPIVILTGPALEAQYSTPIGVRIVQALAVAVWCLRVFMRWMEITAMSAPNPMYIGNQKGGAL